MPYREYTHCVQPEDYVDPVPDLGTGDQIANFVFGGSFDKARQACDYLLGGKLICLGGDRCAIGRITEFHPAKSSFPDGIDNDFSFDILLSPHELGEFTSQTPRTNYGKVAGDGLQGWLISEQKKPNGATLMPRPRQVPTDIADQVPSVFYHADFTKEPSRHYISYDPANITTRLSITTRLRLIYSSTRLNRGGRRETQQAASASALADATGQRTEAGFESGATRC